MRKPLFGSWMNFLLGRFLIQEPKSSGDWAQGKYGRSTELLSAYRWSPRMGIGKDYVFERKSDIPKSGNAHFNECVAIDWLLRDAEIGRMYRYKVCPECKKWFYTMTDHQRFCGEPCRKRYASHSDEYKTKRREYMRRYRHDQKTLDDAAREFARRGKLSDQIRG